MATGTAYSSLRTKNGGELVEDTLDGNSTTTDAAGGKIYAAGAKAVRLQVAAVSGAHTTHVCKLQTSLDGTTFADTATTITGVGQAVITAPDSKWYRAKITTAEGGASSVKAYVAVIR